MPSRREASSELILSSPIGDDSCVSCSSVVSSCGSKCFFNHRARAFRFVESSVGS